MNKTTFSQFSKIPEHLSNYLDALFPKGPSPIQIQTLLLLEDPKKGVKLSEKLSQSTTNYVQNLLTNESNGDQSESLIEKFRGADEKVEMIHKSSKIISGEVLESEEAFGSEDGSHETNSHGIQPPPQDVDTNEEKLISNKDADNQNQIQYTLPLESFTNTGTSLLMESKSGTGKTLSYLLAALIGTHYGTGNDILILVPTNELVWQVKLESRKLLAPCIQREEVTIIDQLEVNDLGQSFVGRRIFITTPHKWLNALERKCISRFESISVFIMDEVDALLDEQSIVKVKRSWNRLLKCRIRHHLPRPRVLAYTATFEKWVISELLHIRIINQDDTFFESVIPRFDRSVKGIREYYIFVKQKETRSETLIEKEKILMEILLKVHFHKCIIFCNRKARCKALVEFLNKNKVPGVASLIGGIKSVSREVVLNNFTESKSHILATTDVAARGLDIPSVDLVINLDVPHDAPTYMHRIGRTGRFGRMGAAVTIVADTQESLFEYVRRLSSNESTLISSDEVEYLNTFMSHDPNTQESKDSFYSDLKKIQENEIIYIEGADQEPQTAIVESAPPKEYQFDFELPVIEESTSSFRIGHIQILLPTQTQFEKNELEHDVVNFEDNFQHPFPMLHPYQLAITNPAQLLSEKNGDVFVDCTKIYREHYKI